MNKCILCNSNKFQELFAGRNWKVMQCLNCNLIKVDRKTKNISYDFYHRDEDYKKLEGHFRNIFQTRVNLVKKFIHKKGKVLEIGCSNGTMLDIFAKDGWETWGVEPSENAEYAIDKGHKVFQSTFEKVNLPKDIFDLIIMNHTLEHLENPVEIMKKANTLLTNGGLILIDVPNYGSLLSKLIGRYWPYLLPFEHNFQFTKKTLKKIFEKANFQVICFKSRSGIFEFADPVSEIEESAKGLKRRFIYHVFNFPYDLLATVLNMGDSMSMVGKKI
ncbi:class I SAM-dependent methyltransferase [Candidatus Microgenomates bacterium]|nr:class I SAM-dependent methyltransferase [Candidatus Microgenomates bacterium]